MRSRSAASAMTCAFLPSLALALAPSAAGTPAPWSLASTWPAGETPRAGACVTIAADEHVLLDESPPVLSGLRILGRLSVRDGGASALITLTANVIQVEGSLEAGKPHAPHEASLHIVLDDQASSDCGFMYRFLSLAVSGPDASLSLFGKPLGPSWTRLATSAHAGTRQIGLSQPPEWPTGAEVVVASSDYDAHQAEVRSITNSHDAKLSLSAPLNFTHFGEILADGRGANGRGVDARSEVGLLSRNIVLRGTPRVDPSRYNRAQWRFNECDGNCRIGGHVIVLRGAHARLSWVQLDRLGDEGQIARYALHFHVLGAGGAQSAVTNVSVTRSHNRFVAIHATQGLLLADSVGYDCVGHGEGASAP